MNGKYSAEEKFQIVLESFSDNVSQAEICRRHGVSPVHLRRWKEQFIQGGKKALSESAQKDTRDQEINDLKRIIGEQTLVMDAFKKRLQGRSK
jgi:transposase-like protein